METKNTFIKPTGPNTKHLIKFICQRRLPCNKNIIGNNRVEIIRLAGVNAYVVRSLRGPSKTYGFYKDKPPCRSSEQCDKVEDTINRMIACGISDNYVSHYLLTLEKSWNLCDLKYNNHCRFLGFPFWP